MTVSSGGARRRRLGIIGLMGLFVFPLVLLPLFWFVPGARFYAGMLVPLAIVLLVVLLVSNVDTGLSTENAGATTREGERVAALKRQYASDRINEVEFKRELEAEEPAVQLGFSGDPTASFVNDIDGSETPEDRLRRRYA